MSPQDGDGGEPSNVSRQVIPRLWSGDRIGSWSEGFSSRPYLVRSRLCYTELRLPDCRRRLYGMYCG